MFKLYTHPTALLSLYLFALGRVVIEQCLLKHVHLNGKNIFVEISFKHFFYQKILQI
jgi:hypothetical protein